MPTGYFYNDRKCEDCGGSVRARSARCWRCHTRKVEPNRQMRTITLIDDREYCIVPQCGVRSRKLDEHGVCPAILHDEKHDRYLAAVQRNKRVA